MLGSPGSVRLAAAPVFTTNRIRGCSEIDLKRVATRHFSAAQEHTTEEYANDTRVPLPYHGDGLMLVAEEMKPCEYCGLSTTRSSSFGNSSTERPELG